MAARSAEAISVRPARLAALTTARAHVGIDGVWTVAGIACVAGILGLVMTVGADARWLAALGGRIAAGGIPRGVPYASASTAHWANAIVLAELVFHGLEHAFGDRGLLLANLFAVSAGLGVLAADARLAGARGLSTAIALSLVGLGALPTLAIARVQMFSLIIFPVLVLLLRAEARAPSRRIWLALPLLALWSNLHGAVLAGVAVLYAYLLIERRRQEPLIAALLAASAVAALCATPAGFGTLDYFRGLLNNVAAQSGVGQWAPLGSGSLDWLLIATTVLLASGLLRRRPRGWEVAVLVGLGVLTVKASRDGVWLLFFLVAPAATAHRPRQSWAALVPLVAATGALAFVVDVIRSPPRSGASPTALSTALRLAQGSPILADAIPAEQIALSGGRIWVGNPLDAFSRRVQAQYLSWIDGQRSARAAIAASGARVVLVTPGSSAERATVTDGQFRRVMGDATADVFVRATG